MDIGLLQKRFGEIGARLKVGEALNRWGRTDGGIDIRTDGRGEYFDIRVEAGDAVEYDVVNLRPELRHLLLMARRPASKEKFLCGHDERHWFVCAVPGSGVTDVRAALEALQPLEVRWAVARNVRRAKNRLRRHNEAFTRQGEWFFVPAPSLVVNETFVQKKEPISRGRGSKPHTCQYLYRTGGERVMVCRQRPRGVTLDQYRKLLKTNPKASKWDWREMRRGAAVYVRGRVWHGDHKTVVLDAWHRVLMNTENSAPGSERVVFLD